MGPRPIALVAFAAALAVSACGGGGRPHDQKEASSLAAERAKTTSEFQKPMLADGVVTYAEYERAALAEIDCIKKALPGVRVDGPHATQGDHPILEYTLEVVGDVPVDEETRFEESQAKCHRTYLSDVGSVWAIEDVPSEEERKALLVDLGACLSRAGLDLPEKTELDDISDALDDAGEMSDEAGACMEQHGSVLVAPPA